MKTAAGAVAALWTFSRKKKARDRGNVLICFSRASRVRVLLPKAHGVRAVCNLDCFSNRLSKPTLGFPAFVYRGVATLPRAHARTGGETYQNLSFPEYVRPSYCASAPRYLPARWSIHPLRRDPPVLHMHPKAQLDDLRYLPAARVGLRRPSRDAQPARGADLAEVHRLQGGSIFGWGHLACMGPNASKFRVFPLDEPTLLATGQVRRNQNL
jgi:hypothetical protein